MKVAHITPSFYPAFAYGGTTESVYRLCTALAEQGMKIKVLTTNANGPHEVLSAAVDVETVLRPSLTVRYLPRWLPQAVTPKLLSRIMEYVQWADVVHLTAVYSFTTWPTLLACRRYRKPLVWSPRGALQRWSGSRKMMLKSLWDWISLRACPKHTVLHVTSEEEAKESQECLCGLVVRIVPNGVALPAHVPRRQESEVFRLLYLGRLDPKKGIENLIEACLRLKGPLQGRWHLTIAGAGTQNYERRLRAQIQQKDLGPHIQLIGQINGPAKEELFAQNDVLVAPSHTENFCIVVAEALAHGMPVVTSQGTPWRRVEEKNCGFWVSNDPATLADAIQRIHVQPLAVMGEHGRQWMEQEYSWPHVASMMMEIYRTLEGTSR